MKKHLILGLALLLCTVQIAVAGGSRRGTAGATFLQIPVGARSSAMGLTGIANARGADAVYWNPARAAFTEDMSLSFSHLDYFADMDMEYIAGVKRVGDFGVIGFSFQYFSFGDIQVTTALEPDGTGGTISPFDMAFGIIYANQITDRAAFGINVKFVNESMRSVTAKGIAVDLGFSFDTGLQGVSFGVAMLNYGPQMKFEGSGLNRTARLDNFDPNASPNNLQIDASPFELPSSVRMGISIQPWMNYSNSFTLNIEQFVNAFANNNTNFGGEFSYNDFAFLRGGYNANTDFDGGATFGGGLQGSYSGFEVNVDYAYMDLGILDQAHRLTFGIGF